jgi:hypothetical protein
MGDSSRLGPGDVVAFIDQTPSSTSSRPTGCCWSRWRERAAAFQSNGACVGDALDEEVSGIFDRRQGTRVCRVPRAKVALEVRGPEIIGPGRHRWHNTGMLPLPPAAPLLHQSAPGQKMASGADGRPVERGRSTLEPGEEFGRSPAPMLPAHRTDCHRGVRHNAM